MDDEPEVIRQQMEETRSSLTDKIGLLEQTVTEKVQTTTAAVTDTVESVKEAVHDTVDTVKNTVSETVGSVKDAFDLRRYVDQYPWASVGAAVGVGVVTGLALGHAPKPGDFSNVHSRGEMLNGGPTAMQLAAAGNTMQPLL